MTTVTYKIKTHNPIVLILIALPTVFFSIWLLSDYGRGITMIVGVLILFGVLALCNYFLGNIIEVQLTENKIATTWAKLPFFIKSYDEILWTDIVDWNFESWRMADTFYIKTREKKKLYIRCLNLFKRQEHLDDFLQTFQEYYSKYKQTSDETRECNIPFVAKPIGRVFAFAYFIIVAVGSYIVFVKNKMPLTSLQGLKTIFVSAILLFFVGATIYFYFKKNKNKN